MKNKKIARTYRLDQDADKKIKALKKLYSKKLGVNVSEADVINILVKNEWESIDEKEKK